MAQSLRRSFTDQAKELAKNTITDLLLRFDEIDMKSATLKRSPNKPNLGWVETSKQFDAEAKYLDTESRFS